MKGTFIAAILAGLVLLPTELSAKLNAGLGFSLAWPQKDFAKQVDLACGLAGRVGWDLAGESPIAATLFFDVNFLNYGQERRAMVLSTITPDVIVDVITDNFMLLGSPGFSLGLKRGRVRPYGEVFGGLTFIATVTSIEDRYYYPPAETSIEDRGLGSKTLDISTNLSDFTTNIGFGAGLQVLVCHKNVAEVLIDIKFTYIKGGKAEYLKEGSITRTSSGDVHYDKIQSATDMTRLQIGVSLVL